VKFWAYLAEIERRRGSFYIKQKLPRIGKRRRGKAGRHVLLKKRINFQKKIGISYI